MARCDQDQYYVYKLIIAIYSYDKLKQLPASTSTYASSCRTTFVLHEDAEDQLPCVDFPAQFGNTSSYPADGC